MRRRDVARKGAGDFVTEIDRQVEAMLAGQLAKALPSAGFLGEESDPRDLEREWVWVADPIDGTSNFANGLPHHGVAVALLWRCRPVVGVVHCAPENATYTAIAGWGAWRQRRPIRVASARTDDRAIIGCQWHRGPQELEFLARLQTSGARIRTFGCTVAQLVDVAMGRLDANVQQQGRVWDIAAAGLVAVESGAQFTDWGGRPLFPFASLDQGHLPSVAAAPAAHRRICRLLSGLAKTAVVPSA
jgi:myo-inositol-1(or 4)-monophosphatase